MGSSADSFQQTAISLDKEKSPSEFSEGLFFSYLVVWLLQAV